jgi:hypothetical protein
MKGSDSKGVLSGCLGDAADIATSFVTDAPRENFPGVGLIKASKPAEFKKKWPHVLNPVQMLSTISHRRQWRN